ncbi:hypothetical protein M3N55_16490 [Roseibaca sp. V10]|uniref:Translocation protein TolB n=1 Tax=Roseinatronobacter domitianus TaxID=2940293 RepID=A0ABT0M637_9RHOB|nr:PQQ-binding-like beta-propeller repeat protein [Roseibaca domitiana]MCL1630307.1 hypothetical protein [Roseibaca domitiana]
MKILVTIVFILFASALRAEEEPARLSLYGSFLHSAAAPHVLFFFSDIEENDAFELRRALRNHEIKLVVLLSSGGSVWESLIMAGILFDRGIDTYVPDIYHNGGCYSACAFMFFAGQNSLAVGDLAVHQVGSYDPDLDDLKRRQAETQQATQFTTSEIIGFLNEFNTPPWVFEKMFRSRAFYHFSDEEKQELSVGELDPEIQRAADDFLQVFFRPPDWTNASSFSLEGHTGNVMSASFSPDGRLILTSGHRTARIWDSETGSEVATLTGHHGQLWDAAFSPDGGRVVTASFDRTARIWDANTGDMIATLRHPSGLFQADFSPDGKQIITASSDGTAHIWDIANQREVLKLSARAGPLLTAAFSQDGMRIVTDGNDSTARIWDAKTGQEIAVIRASRQVTDAEFSPDMRSIVTASSDGAVRIWNSETGQEIATLIEPTGITSRNAKFSFDGSLVVTGDVDGTVRILDIESGQEVAELKGAEVILGLDISSNGMQIVAGGSNDKIARVWTAK